MTRCGLVALVGAPNAGKSTLLNRLVGQNLAAITPKPQTTRFRIPAIRTEGETQFIFVDTPGWVSNPKNPWHIALTQQSLAALREADVSVWVLSAAQPIPTLPPPTEKALQKAPCLLAALTHLDLYPSPSRATKLAEFQSKLTSFSFQNWIDISLDQPLEPFLQTIAAYLPESPFLYPSDALTPLPQRFFVGEILRSQVYQHLHEEIPYGTEVEITLYKEQPERDYIAATLYVEKESHKPIVIGKGGQMLKKIGTAARQEIEQLIGKPVFLELHVKVAPKWRRSPTYLRRLGYRTS
ncbi:MAG: GTPase Era [Bacteroidia bacterium]|nr:GTPase Era [Bacteroidia bacterium]MDW8089631.1 GTPase Era [Bacteroidia bacterium]